MFGVGGCWVVNMKHKTKVGPVSEVEFYLFDCWDWEQSNLKVFGQEIPE